MAVNKSKGDLSHPIDRWWRWLTEHQRHPRVTLIATAIGTPATMPALKSF